MVVGSTTLVGISSLKKGSSECIVIGIQNPGIIFSLFVSSLFMDCIQSMTRSLDSFFCEQNSIHGKDTYPLQSFSPRQEIDIEVRRNFWAVQKGNMAVCLGSPVEVWYLKVGISVCVSPITLQESQGIWWVWICHERTWFHYQYMISVHPLLWWWLDHFVLGNVYLFLADLMKWSDTVDRCGMNTECWDDSYEVWLYDALVIESSSIDVSIPHCMHLHSLQVFISNFTFWIHRSVNFLQNIHFFPYCNFN